MWDISPDGPYSLNLPRSATLPTLHILLGINSQQGNHVHIGIIGTPPQMGKTQPPGTVTHTVFLPTDLHRKVTAIAPDGRTADDVIIECVRDSMEQRWKEWLKKEAGKVGCNLTATSGGKIRK